MINFIKDLPDPVVGCAAAGAAWFGVCYAFLAERAMNNDLEEDVYPVCIAQLDDEQTIAIDEAVRRAAEKAESARSQAMRELRERQSELAEARNQLSYYESMRRMYRDSGLGDLFPIPDIDVPTVDEVDAMQRNVSERMQALNIPINIDYPRVPKPELLKRCACAATTAVAGKRTSYSISLASFRLVSPSDVSSLKSDVSQAVNLDICGQKPWENLS